MAKLTKRVVDAQKPRETTDYFVWDDELPGFGVRVRPSGRKLYVLQYRDPAGASRRIALGEHGPYTPERARAEAARQRADVLAARRDPSQRDPATQRQQAKLTARATLHAPTVAEVADVFLQHAAAKLRPTTVAEYRRLLGVTSILRGPARGKSRIGELRSALGRFKVADVVRAQVSRLHLSMRNRPYMANRALAALSATFSYAEREGFRPDGSNPCRGIAPYRERKRVRMLSDSEYAALGNALNQAERDGVPRARAELRRKATAATTRHRSKTFGAPTPANPVGIAALRFLLLTGWRESEALTLRWTQVDLARGTATLLDTKTGRSERELGAPAVAVVDAMQAFRLADNPYVFPGTKARAHFTDTARLWRDVRLAAGMPDVRLHDLRHAYASIGLLRGLGLPVIGALLGHKDVASTSRYAHLADSTRKRAADIAASAVAGALAGTPATPPVATAP